MYLLLDLLHSIYFDAPGMSRVIEERMRQAGLAQDIFAHVKERSRSPLCTRMSDIGESGESHDRAEGVLPNNGGE